MKKFILIMFFLISNFILSGCGTITVPVQVDRSIEPKELSSQTEFGQTFFSRENGLSAIDIYFARVKQSGTVKIKLFSINDRGEPLFTSEKAIDLTIRDEFIRFDFGQNISSLNQDYYLTLSVDDAGVFEIGNSYADVYSSGSMYENGKPNERQLSFQLIFDQSQVVLGLLTIFFQWIIWMLIAILVFFIPGFAIFNAFWGQKKSLSLGSIVGISFGIGVAIYPVFLLWTKLIGLKLNQWNVWVLVIPSSIYVIYIIRKYLKQIKGQPLFKQIKFSEGKGWILFTYFVVVAAIVFTRFWVIRSLEVPMWGDSYQHAMISQLILDNGGLFESWLPYVPYETLTVQYGFPTASAMFSWISGESAVYSTLITGQILNILAILVLFPLSEKVSKRNEWAGIFAMIIAGILSTMPAMYVNWGRYAQLSGQVVLPILMWLMWELLEKENQFTIKRLVLFGLVLAGMSLNYYRTPFIFAFFPLTIILFSLIKCWRSKGFWLHILKVNIPIIIIAVVLLIPWATRLAGSNLSAALEAGVVKEIPLQSVINDYQAWLGIKNYVPLILIIFSFFALLFGLIKKNKNIWIIFLWAVLISLYKFTQIYNFPGANMMQSFTILIMLYIPVSLLVGTFVAEFVKFIPQWRHPIVFVLIIFVLIPGTNTARKIVNEPFYAIVKRPDLRAMDWIKENTEINSTFLIEGFRIYNGQSSVGADGGWYIPLFTQRQNTIPPQYALLNEKPMDAGYSESVTERIRTIEESGFSQIIPEFCSGELTHIYIGQDHGLVGENNPKLFDEDNIELEYFSLVYQEDRVRIYQFKDNICGN